MHAALDAGINYFDVAPAYGATRAETVLGRALREVPRARYFLSTKVGKYTNPGAYGDDTLDYSRARIRASLDESAAPHRRRVLRHRPPPRHRVPGPQAHRVGARRRARGPAGAEARGPHRRGGLRHLPDGPVAPRARRLRPGRGPRAQPLLPERHAASRAAARRAAHGSRHHQRLAVRQRPPDRPRPRRLAPRAERTSAAVFRRAAEFCREQGTSLGKLALQFASQNPEIPTTLFSSASPASVARNVEWHEEPFDPSLVERVQAILASVRDKQWSY